MRRRLTSIGAMSAASLIAFAATAFAASTTLPLPVLSFSLGMSISPQALPKRDHVPARATVLARVATTDGSHPSALREVVFDIRDVRVDTSGYPVCRAGTRDLRHPTRARKVCGTSIVGSGAASLEIAFPELSPIRVASPVTVFNGGTEAGETTLLVHSVITVPVPAAIVTRVTIEKRGGGIHAVARIPVIAGGSGSLLGLKFNVGRTFARQDRKAGLLEARCPDGRLEVKVSKAVFKNEAATPGVPAQTVMKGTALVPCTPKG